MTDTSGKLQKEQKELCGGIDIIFRKSVPLTLHPAASEATVRYRGDDDKGQAIFTIQFQEDIELIGYLKRRLWVEAEGADDMDLFVLVQKLSREGDAITHAVVSPPKGAEETSFSAFHYPGPNGRMRVSHRRLDEKSSDPSIPCHTHKVEEFLRPGQVVPVEIPIWPTAMRWHAGEQLRLVVAGYNLNGPSFPGMPLTPTRNKGDHIIHTGGKYDAYLLIPNIPGGMKS